MRLNSSGIAVSAERLGPFLRFLGRVEFADESVDASRKLAQESDVVPGAAITLGHQDRINEDRHNEALGIIDLFKSAQLRERFAPRRQRIGQSFSSSDTPAHLPTLPQRRAGY